MMQFLSGAICTAHLVIALFFLRFWRRTRDRFFIFLSASFFLLALERVVISLLPESAEMTPYPYTIRLVAFTLLIVGIVIKNREK